LLLLGLALTVLGPLAFWIQLQQKLLTAPWYLPMVGTLGAVLCLLAVLRARSLVRWLALALGVLLAAGEWLMLSPVATLPAYAGPASAGHTLPEFTACLADGAPFTRADLRNGKNTVLLFFRGRW
jgi:hypothetical protein